jgi:hypothetical protein
MKGIQGGEKKKNASGVLRREESAEGTLPCTRQTSLCTCASANFRVLDSTDGEGEGDVDEVDMGESGEIACSAVAI